MIWKIKMIFYIFLTILNFLAISYIFFFLNFFSFLINFVHSSIHLKYFFYDLFIFFLSLNGLCFVFQDERLKNVWCICLCEIEKYFKNFFTPNEKILWIFNYPVKNFIFLILVREKHEIFIAMQFLCETTKFCFYVNILKILLVCTSF